MFNKSYKKNIVFKRNGKKTILLLERYSSSKELDDVRKKLIRILDEVIDINWGKFGNDFIRKHIIYANKLLIVRDNQKVVALAAASRKTVLDHEILYLEFTVVHPSYEGLGVSRRLNEIIITEAFLERLIKKHSQKLEVMTISPNLRIVSSLAKAASKIYPNPFQADHEGKVPMPETEVLNMARELIKKSDYPNRRVNPEGLVLEGSYYLTPWLIREKPQLYYDTNVNLFGKKYIEYHKRADKEFIIWARFDLVGIVKYYLKKHLNLVN